MSTPVAADASVLIVNWNAGRLLHQCLEAIPAALGAMTGEVVVVDNASTDGSVDDVPRAPWLTIARRPDNAGFAAGTNHAARLAGGRYLLLLNPDTACRPDSIATMARFLDANPDVAAVGPRLLHADGRPQRSCWRGYPGVKTALIDALYLWKLPRLPFVRSSEIAPAASGAPLDVDHLLGACMLVPRGAWERVGPLDDGYFLFFEETDWCRRAKAAGYRIAHLPAAVVVHHGEHSVYQAPTSSMVHFYRSFLRFMRRSGRGPLAVAGTKACVAAGVVVRLGLWSWRRLGPRRDLARGMLRGYLRVLFELPSY